MTEFTAGNVVGGQGKFLRFFVWTVAGLSPDFMGQYKGLELGGALRWFVVKWQDSDLPKELAILLTFGIPTC